jgi:hypothetical protein
MVVTRLGNPLFILQEGPCTPLLQLPPSVPTNTARRRVSIPSSITTTKTAQSATSCGEYHSCAHYDLLCRFRPPQLRRRSMTTRDAGPSMTALYSRSPLQLLTMSSSQRPTRRKTRHTFDDDEEPPAKRPKADIATTSNGAAKSVNGKPKTAAPKRSKAGTCRKSGLTRCSKNEVPNRRTWSNAWQPVQLC